MGYREDGPQQTNVAAFMNKINTLTAWDVTGKSVKLTENSGLMIGVKLAFRLWGVKQNKRGSAFTIKNKEEVGQINGN